MHADECHRPSTWSACDAGSMRSTTALGGTPAAGMTRPALSGADRAARDVFVDWLHELNLAVRVDDFGNIYGRRAGLDERAAPVLIGSHLGTVPLGRRFDGILASSPRWR